MQAIYDYFAHAPAGSFANHLAHCLVAAAITLIVAVVLLPWSGLTAATGLGCLIAAAIYVGRAQAQTETILAPAPWWESWLPFRWGADQVWGAGFPIVSSALIYLLMLVASG